MPPHLIVHHKLLWRTCTDARDISARKPAYICRGLCNQEFFGRQLRTQNTRIPAGKACRPVTVASAITIGPNSGEALGRLNVPLQLDMPYGCARSAPVQFPQLGRCALCARGGAT